MGTVLNNITEVVKIVSVLIWPFMPQTAEKVQHQLGLGIVGVKLDLDSLKEWGKIRQVRPISKAPPLFPRVKREKEEEVKEKPEPISLADFQRLDLRVGTIKEAEPIPGSKKLLKLTVDIGEERTIVAGLADHYQMDGLKDKQVIVLANLRPVRLKGVESQGMILAAEDEEGIHILIPDKESKPGSIIR
jgi:methionyl-tRNA synthetase